MAFVMVVLSALILTPRKRAAIAVCVRRGSGLCAVRCCWPEWGCVCRRAPLCNRRTPVCCPHRLQPRPPSAVILYVLGFASRGFTWVHGALFAAMISSTDALAATAILKQGEVPHGRRRAGMVVQALQGRGVGAAVGLRCGPLGISLG